MKRLYRSIGRSLRRTFRRSKKKRGRKRRTKKMKPKKTKPKKRKPKRTKKEKVKGEMEGARAMEAAEAAREAGAAREMRARAMEAAEPEGAGGAAGPEEVVAGAGGIPETLIECFRKAKAEGEINYLAVDFDDTLCFYGLQLKPDITEGKGGPIWYDIVQTNLFDDHGKEQPTLSEVLIPNKFNDEVKLKAHIEEYSRELISIMSNFEGPILLVTKSESYYMAFVSLMLLLFPKRYVILPGGRLIGGGGYSGV